MNTSEALNRMAAITSAQSEIAAYNDDLDRYVTGALIRAYAAAGIRVHDGKISSGDVMRASSIYHHNVYGVFGQRARDLMEDMHERGFDVRMNMQDYRLVWKGVYRNV